MSPSDISAMHRMASASPLSLPMILGSILVADAVLCHLGIQMLPAGFEKPLATQQVALAIGIGITVMSSLIWAVVPVAGWLWRLLMVLLHLYSLAGCKVDPKHLEFYYRISDVIRRSVEKNSRQMFDLANQRKAEVEKEQNLRTFCAALLVAILISVCTSGSLLRNLGTVLAQPGWLQWIGSLALCIFGLLVFLLGIQAFLKIEHDEMMPRREVEPLMEEKRDGEGPGIGGIGRHGR